MKPYTSTSQTKEPITIKKVRSRFVGVVALFCCIDVFGTVESVKAAADLYAPVGGVVCEVNGSLSSSPSLVNEDPYEKGTQLIFVCTSALMSGHAFMAFTAWCIFR